MMGPSLYMIIIMVTTRTQGAVWEFNTGDDDADEEEEVCIDDDEGYFACRSLCPDFLACHLHQPHLQCWDNICQILKILRKKSSFLDMGQTHLRRYDRRNVLVKFVSRLVIRRIILRQFWQLIFDHCFHNFDDCKDNLGDLWHLRHWLQFWQLRTWILTIFVTNNMIMMMTMTVTWMGQYIPLHPSCQSIPPPFKCHNRCMCNTHILYLRIWLETYFWRLPFNPKIMCKFQFSHLVLHFVEEPHREAIGTVPKILLVSLFGSFGWFQ